MPVKGTKCVWSIITLQLLLLLLLPLKTPLLNLPADSSPPYLPAETDGVDSITDKTFSQNTTHT